MLSPTAALAIVSIAQTPLLIFSELFPQDGEAKDVKEGSKKLFELAQATAVSMLTDKDSGLLNAQTELPEAKKNLHIPEDFDCLNEKKKVGMLPLSCNESHLRI